MSDVWGILSKYLKKPSATVEVSGFMLNMEFDVVSSEQHQWEANVTSNPVEIGSTINDHVQLQPDKLDISGIISNSTLEGSKGKFLEKLFDFLDGETAVQKAFDQLRKLLESCQPVTVYTRYKTYNDMVLTSLSIPRTVENGDSIEFTASFTHIKRVSTLTVNAEDAGINPKSTSDESIGRKSQPQQNQGNTTPRSVTPEDTKKVVEVVQQTGQSSNSDDHQINDF